MILARCAWHVSYFGHGRLLGVRRWLPLWPLTFTDGICRRCQRRLREPAYRKSSVVWPAPSLERHQARSLRAWLMPWAYVTLLALAAALVIAVGVSWVSAVHRARVAEQAACRAEIRTIQAHSAWARGVVIPADPCVALRVVMREGRR